MRPSVIQRMGDAVAEEVRARGQRGAIQRDREAHDLQRSAGPVPLEDGAAAGREIHGAVHEHLEVCLRHRDVVALKEPVATGQQVQRLRPGVIQRPGDAVAEEVGARGQPGAIQRDREAHDLQCSAGRVPLKDATAAGREVHRAVHEYLEVSLRHRDVVALIEPVATGQQVQRLRPCVVQRVGDAVVEVGACGQPGAVQRDREAHDRVKRFDSARHGKVRPAKFSEANLVAVRHMGTAPTQSLSVREPLHLENLDRLTGDRNRGTRLRVK